MKKDGLVKEELGLMVVLLLAATVLLGCASEAGPAGLNSAPAEEKIVWRANATSSPVEVYNRDQYYGWAMRELVERTGGRFEVQSYWNSELGFDAREWPKVLKEGLVEVTDLPFVMGSSYIPALAYAQMPMYQGLKKYSKETAYLAHEARRKIYREDIFPQWNGIMLNSLPEMPMAEARGEFVATKPVRNLEELNSITMGKSSAFSPFGLKSTVMSMPEGYLALKTGVIDAIHLNRDSYVRYRLHEVAKYLIVYRDVIEYSLGGYGWAANTSHWAKLPPDIQRVVLEVYKEFQDRIDHDARDEKRPPDQAQVDRIIKNMGITVITFSPEDQLALQDAADRILAEWLWKADRVGQRLFKSDMAILGRSERFDGLLALGKILTGYPIRW